MKDLSVREIILVKTPNIDILSSQKGKSVLSNFGTQVLRFEPHTQVLHFEPRNEKKPLRHMRTTKAQISPCIRTV